VAFKKDKNKPVMLTASLCGEMAVESIPAAASVDVAALKAGDDDPMEVVVEVPAGKSTRGWDYKPEALRDIVNHVNLHTLNGFLGHQKPEDVASQFLPPVTHWVGAKYENGKAYFRGVIDASAKDLKRWIRSKRVKQVSIFGMPKLRVASGETAVLGYKPFSIDWTPLDRSGMPTRIVAVGEMDFIGAPDDGDSDFEGEMSMKELLEKIREALRNRQLTVPMIAGEMGWKADQIAGEIDADWLKKATGEMTLLADVIKELGVEPGQAVTKVKELVKVAGEMVILEQGKIMGEMLTEKVKSDPVRQALTDEKTLLGKLFKSAVVVKSGMTKEQISGEIDAFMSDEAVKGEISRIHTDPTPPGTKFDNRNDSNNNTGGLRSKRVAL